MASITCAHCKGTHPSVAEVRACAINQGVFGSGKYTTNYSKPSAPDFFTPIQVDKQDRPSNAKKFIGEGWYKLGGDIVKVQRAVHGSGNLYAKRLVVNKDTGTAHWDYEPGLRTKLDPSMQLTEEQAADFGKLYGICCICGAVLTNEKSIDRGIGPICAGNMGW